MKNKTHRHDPARSSQPRTKGRQAPLSDDRFHALLSKAGEFFAEAERDVEAEKPAVIAEIRQTMDVYGLTVDDLR